MRVTAFPEFECFHRRKNGNLQVFTLDHNKFKKIIIKLTVINVIERPCEKREPL